MRAAISICIPTCNRLELLQFAVASCLEQAYRPLEILIGDDSSNGETERWVAGVATPDGVEIRYEQNVPRLGQSENVNRLFDRATSPRLLLLHDDDLLFPGGLDILAEAWATASAPRCVYGGQQIIDADGAPRHRETKAWNRRYFRVAERRGSQRSAIAAALLQQVPNNCYLIDSELSRETRYRPEREVGHCVDAEFVVRAGMKVPPRSFVFVDAMVSKYRLTPDSIARSATLNRRQDLFYRFVESVQGDREIEEAKATLLARISVGAALDAAMAGERRLAFRIIFSRSYEMPLLSRWTLYRLVCAVSPRVGSWGKIRIDRWARSRPPSGPPVCSPTARRATRVQMGTAAVQPSEPLA